MRIAIICLLNGTVFVRARGFGAVGMALFLAGAIAAELGRKAKSAMLRTA